MFKLLLETPLLLWLLLPPRGEAVVLILLPPLGDAVVLFLLPPLVLRFIAGLSCAERWVGCVALCERALLFPLRAPADLALPPA
jgi:hypothetical protein